MSQRLGGGSGRPYKPLNDQERHQYQRCVEMGLQYPPDPVQVYALIHTIKKDGEYALNNRNIEGALSMYTIALKGLELFTNLPHFAEEYHKLLGNRSLVFLKMRRFKEAERDAVDAIAFCPSFIKGYWRASEAVKGGYNGVQRALPYLLEGLRLTLRGEGNIHDIVMFLTEVCILVPRAPSTDAMEKLLTDQLDIPDSVNGNEIWNKVIQKLATQNNWKSLAMLLTGYNEGVSCALEDQNTATWNWSSVNVGSLLSFLTDDAFIKWGEKLAVKMVEFGSDFEQIGKQFGCPSLHHVVRLSLSSGSLKLLRCILQNVQRIPDMINSVDQDGSTALHILVRSDIGAVNIKHAVLDLLLENKCNAAVMDRSNKKPIDYIHQKDGLYKKLSSIQLASKSVDELRHDLEALKSQGNIALKAENYSEALSKYDEALFISQQSKQLYKEAAILYSNRAKVYFTLQNYMEALANAIAAISCDSCWHKGHFWKAKTLLTMGSSHDAFGAYLDGFNLSKASRNVKLDLIVEAVTQLKHVTSENFMTCYNQLRFLDRDIWQSVLSKLSRDVEWKCIAYLILGPNLDGQRFGEKVDRTSMEFLCSGVAGSCDTIEVQTNTIFQYIRDRDCDPKLDGPWLDAVLFAVYMHGHDKTLKCLAVDDTDCPLHAAVRFAFLTGRESLLEELALFGKEFLEQMAVNPGGDSVFHFIAQFRPPPEIEILTKIKNILLRTGMSLNVKDAKGKLPIDYLDSGYPRSVFGMFAPPPSYSVDDINKLKEEGNVLFTNGAFADAVEMYSKAIDILRSSEEVHANLTKHEIAVLYGNRAEAFLKIQQYQPALDDAMQSVTFDSNWYKAHLRVGKAMRGLHKIEEAKAAFIKAYCSLKINVEDKVKVNILVELASVCSEMPKSVWNVKRMIGDLPKGQGHLWACACYELASNSCWKKAAVAYYQFSYSVSKKQHLTWTLKPFSDLAMLKQHPWGLEMMSYFLKCGCNRKTISLEHGDTYLHAVIRISLVVGNLTLLEYLVQQYCRQGNTDQHELDINNNSVLHAATKEKKVDKEKRYNVIVLLLGCNVNPNLQNASGQLAIDYLPKKETQSREVLRMAMYRKENISKLAAPSETSRKQTQGRSQPLTEVKQTNAPTSKAKPKRSCDLCDDLLSQGIIHFGHEEPSEGYEKMVELLKQTHNGSRHEKVCEKAVAEIIKKLAETHNPEIPPCLMSVGRETYLMIVDGLASSNKWRQLDMLVRKFRNMHGSDQLKGFASNLSVVPVVSDTSLKAAEEVKLQIVSNLLNCGATLGCDNGETAVKSAVSEEHFKVLTELVKRGADTTKLSMYDGDTPIHAAMVIVLEKEKSPVLLDFLLDQFESNPDAYLHLDPEQLDQNGNCLFHLIARAKFSTHVLKLTEMLCKKNLSANYFNKEGKLPINYLTKKNDRRLQYLRLARSVAPSREQLHAPNVQRKDDSTALLDEDLHQKQRQADSETNHQVVIDVARAVSLRDQRKKHIEELIRLLPDSKNSIFKVDQTPSGKSVIETERNDKHTEQENMDKENPMENRHTEAKELSNSDRSISKIDNQSSETLVEDSKQVAETYKLAHRKEKSDPLKQENTLGDKTDSISSESKRFEVKDAEPGIRNTDTRHLLLERDRNKTNKKDNAEMNASIEEFVDELSELDSSVTTAEDVDIDVKHEESNDLNGQSNLQHHDTQDNKSKKKEKSCFELKDVELIDRVKVLEEATEEKVMEEETDKVEAEVQADIEAVERVVRVETNNVDNEDEGIDRKVNEMESVDESDYEDEEEPADDYVIDIQVFDNLEWEVECTAEVWKTLRDKHVIPELKRRIVRNIQLLASGDWQPHLCKKLKHVPATLNLFEAKFSKGRRILWELAVAFSPRCSETAERRLQAKSGELTQAVRGGRIYSEIIRVWDIVLDHDKIYRCVQRIKKSHQRGEGCIIQKKLRGMKDNPQVPLGTCKRYPMLYAEEDIPDTELEQHHQDMQRFFPPASSNDTEYHILKFYSFSSTLVSHVLQSIDTKVDFPFRVTDLEHAIINIKSKAPILLLGRSGTGKTTCCLYRLWSQFHAYWLKAKEADAPLLPRCAEFVHQEVEVIISDDEHEVSEEDINEENNDNDECEVEGASGGAAAAGSDTGEMEMAAGQGDIYDHLHQLFITKNAVLSSEVQKNFRELSHADDSMREHVQHEEELLPSRLQDVRDYHYPLFLTSRQLLLMLDASLGPPYFFERKEDGSLKVDIAGWTDLDGPLSFLPLLDEDSDAEDDLEQYVEDDEEDEMAGQGQTTSGKKLKVDPRREITYGVFVEEIWPRIKKKMSGYHPSLVWMEIMSFIKGSFEALSKPNGHLNKEEYFKLGRKRAPNFSGERDTIYQFFLRYEHFKKQNSLFDETDLVHNAFLRLRNVESRTWVIHQIFVDETQDFTQAELGLLIRICQNPNDMFLTGDTAQSIMRGISFRFSDLRSLFYHAKQSMQAMGKTSAVEVPKQVYQLTHNYRSHAGILSLATSVLELLVEFFPESFDRLQPDQGLFHGPRPILLESCSFSDLAVLLRGNRRKTSHIEFGAHQAILVVNDAARDSIPEELRLGLVLTIYEAKGLEFDDVLLYNFFKDSQAMKEWRVVTEYLERLAAQQNVEQETKDNLIQLDHDVLDSAGRPRPLSFDANQHKVLNSELKHLYTALTRARVNVWVFDEDNDKRAPMFEYFKARKLVKCMHVEEINETSLSETMFAEKSSAADWLRRGEDFMRHSLYGVAAKCFGIGGDKEREKIALAHGQALKASRLKDNPREMREEFLHAAELYMECNRPSKAALCLQNAKERELAAQLLEKLGQYERAAEMYIRLKRPMSSSECYEQLGNYHRAVEVLYDNELYDQAIDTLKRYQLIIKDLEQKGKPIPQRMIDHKPVAYTEEKLSHRSAEMFHKYKNEERMLASVDRFQNIVDKVEFLKRKNYIPQAAKILEDDGQLENAAYLLLMCGRFDEAIEIAKKTLKVDVIAQSLLVTCRAILSKKDKIEQNRKLLNEGLRDALEMSRGCNDEDMTGQIYLLQAEFTGELDHIKKAWERFLHSKSFPNAAGLVECIDFLMKIGHMSTYEELQITVKGLDYMFNVCQALLNPNTQTNREKVLKYDQMYGLEPHTQDKLIIHPKEKPFCLNMLQTVFNSKSEREKRVVEVSKTETYENIVLFLLERGRSWLKPIQLALNQMRDATQVCDYFQAGLECPNEGNVDRPCIMMHTPQTNASFKMLINMDLLMIEYEANCNDGAENLKKKSPRKVRDVLEDYLNVETADPRIKYHACETLWNDLMPAAGHPLLVGNQSKALLQYIRRQDKVILHFKKFLQEKWKLFTDGDMKLRSSAARETEVYLLYKFGYHLFGLDTGKRKFDRSPSEEMTQLERLFDNEIASRSRTVKNNSYYTLMMSHDKQGYGDNVNVTCVARRFYDAYELISNKQPDPLEAVVKFSKFQIQLSTRSHTDYNFYPDLKHYIMWLEFFTCVSIFLIAKLKSKNFQDFVFILPNNYFALIHFIQATFPSSGYSVLETVGYWAPSYHKQMHSENLLVERLKGFSFVVSGHAQGIRILDKIVQSCKEDPSNYVLLERLLILNMTLVCNVGKAVPPESESSLMSSMCHINLYSPPSARLQQVLETVKTCKGTSDVATLLGVLLQQRGLGEEMQVCWWAPRKKASIEKTALKNMSLFSQTFINERTLDNMHETKPYREQITVKEIVLEADLDEDEIESGLRDKETQLQEEKLLTAVLLVQRSWRAKLIVRKLRKEKANKTSQRTEADSMFEDIKVDDKMCGICGVFFNDKLEAKLELEKSVFVGGSSVLNTSHAESAVWGGQPLQKQVSDEGKRNQWSTTQENTLDKPELREKLLQNIRSEHVQELRHIQKASELQSFKNKYRQHIAPKLRDINSFLYNPVFNLTDYNNVEKNFGREYMAIDRMFRKGKLVEKEIQLLLKSRMWSVTAGIVEQKVMELEDDFKTVKPYVEEVHLKLEQEEEEKAKQVSASASAMSAHAENWDDELEDIKPVVEEPTPRRKQIFRNRRGRGKSYH